MTDEGTVAYLCENPYAQHLVGLKAFRKEPLFDTSDGTLPQTVHPELLQRVNELMYERAYPYEGRSWRGKTEPRGQRTA